MISLTQDMHAGGLHEIDEHVCVIQSRTLWSRFKDGDRRDPVLGVCLAPASIKTA